MDFGTFGRNQSKRCGWMRIINGLKRISCRGKKKERLTETAPFLFYQIYAPRGPLRTIKPSLLGQELVRFVRVLDR